MLSRARIETVTDAGVWAIVPDLGLVGPLDVIGTPTVGDAALLARLTDTDMVLVCGAAPETTPFSASDIIGWNDLRVALSTGRPNTSPPTFTTFRNGVQAWSFAANSTEQIYFESQLPHGWGPDTEVRPHIHWSPGNSTNTGAVKWELEYSWGNVGGAFPATSTLSVTQAATGTAYAHQLAALGSLDGTGMRDSSVFVCRLARVGGDPADTFTGAAFGVSVDFHYYAARLGSVTEYPPT